MPLKSEGCQIPKLQSQRDPRKAGRREHTVSVPAFFVGNESRSEDMSCGAKEGLGHGARVQKSEDKGSPGSRGDLGSAQSWGGAQGGF